MDLEDYIDKKLRDGDLELFYEAFGPDAWPDMRDTIMDVAQAMKLNDPQALMDATRDLFVDYVTRIAEQDGIDFTADEPESDPDYDPREDDDEYRFSRRSSLDPLLWS